MNDDTKGIDRGLANYGDAGFSRFLRRTFLASAGFDESDLDRVVVGIADTSSDYTPCHRQMPELVEAIRRGVLEAGGLPFVFPTVSLGEPFLSPTSMLFRNLMAMETEEMIRAQPMDAVVLVGGCDKTVPAQLMAAAAVDLPALLVVAGPMLTSSWHGERLGACTDCRRLWAEYRSGGMDEVAIAEAGQHLCTTGGTCMVMGTASTMACVAEALGMMLLGGATAPAASGDRLRQGVAAGRQATRLARRGPRPSQILTRPAFINALTVLMAVGGSTNAIIHLLALARRADVRLVLDDFDDISRRVPLMVDCKPAGHHHMEDFHAAGGVPALLRMLAPLIDMRVWRVEGKRLEDALAHVRGPMQGQQTIATLAQPLGDTEGLAVLRGSLAPEGAVIKVSAATPDLLQHQGRALVFDSLEDAARRIDDPTLSVTPDDVLVLRNVGLVGAGMPEAGSMPIPRRLAERGVRDMVRISDARMSGTAYGTVVLHCSPEAASGGPIALARDGDPIRLDVRARKVDLIVNPRELERRRADWTPPTKAERGWLRLFQDHVLPAHLGADLDFLISPALRSGRSQGATG